MFPYFSMKAFSFLEVIISVVIGSTAFLAILALAGQNLDAVELPRQRFIAANLAQEGIEVLVNMRASNWLTFPTIDPLTEEYTRWRGETSPPCVVPVGADGDQGCLSDGGPYIVQYNGDHLRRPSGTQADLGVDANGRYCHAALPGCIVATPSIYSRTLTITTENDHQFKVTSRVAWAYRGTPREVIIESRLYNWK